MIYEKPNRVGHSLDFFGVNASGTTIESEMGMTCPFCGGRPPPPDRPLSEITDMQRTTYFIVYC